MKQTIKVLAMSLTMALFSPVGAYAQASSTTPVLGQTNAAPLGLELGVATVQAAQTQIGDRTSIRDAGINKYTGGKMLQASGAGLGVAGLREVTLIFDKSDLLVGVIMLMDKRAKDTYKTLAAKYSVKENKIDNFMDYGYARFTKGASIIELSAPHVSFEMEVRYLTKGLLAAYEKKRDAEAKETAEKRSNAL